MCQVRLEGTGSLEFPRKMTMHTQMRLQVLEQVVVWVEGLAQCIFLRMRLKSCTGQQQTPLCTEKKGNCMYNHSHMQFRMLP
jgi:hypothetical protein